MCINCIGGILVRMFASSAVDHGWFRAQVESNKRLWNWQLMFSRKARNIKEPEPEPEPEPEQRLVCSESV